MPFTSTLSIRITLNLNYTIMSYLKVCITLLILSISCGLFAQQIIITGKITDSGTGEPIPYATVAVKGTSIGTNSNFDGFYKLGLKRVDSILISCMGYDSKVIFLNNPSVKTINIVLNISSNALNEVVITPKTYVNPAWEILSQVIKHKPENDSRSLSSYEYESYSRIELDATHFGDRLKNKKFMKSALAIIDSTHGSKKGSSPLLPIFISETVSDYYYRNNPQVKKEEIKRTKTNGIGFEDGTLLSQLTGSTFQQYNFYKNYVSAAGKDFISPITDGWKSNYDYELEDSNAKVNNVLCYQISFKPKRAQDLAFTGTIWITQDNYALSEIKATVEPSVNLNFIKSISIQQQMAQSVNGKAWLPEKTRILVEVDQLTKNTSGLLAKFYTANKNVKVNKIYSSDFFNENIVLADNIQKKDEQFWTNSRPDSLTKEEKSTYHLIDEVKSIPTIKNYIEIADMLINGYYRFGKISFGPLLQSYSNNNVEGNRLRIGFKTNQDFDNKLIFGGYVAYGTKDADFKYGASVDYILSRKSWTEAGISFSHDLNQVALLSDNYAYQRNNLYTVFTKFGSIDRRKVFDQNTFNIYITRDLFKGFTQKVTYSKWSFDPQYQFNYVHPQNKQLFQQFNVSEIQIESKWAPGTQLLLSETVNRRLSIKTNVTTPIFTFRYTLGLRNVMGGDFTYQKFSLNVIQTLKMGSLGRGKYSFTLGCIPSSVPYPLLENHLGNATYIYNPNAFNLMGFFEFASDKYASLNYTQHFEGLLLNYIPAIRKLKWRLVGTANVLYGSISQKNLNNITDQGVKENGLKNTPYIEAGYGVENIFKFIRVDFIHRLTYQNNINSVDGGPKNFGIKISAQLRL
jgi:hypothetical protein